MTSTIPQRHRCHRNDDQNRDPECFGARFHGSRSPSWEVKTFSARWSEVCSSCPCQMSHEVNNSTSHKTARGANETSAHHATRGQFVGDPGTGTVHRRLMTCFSRIPFVFGWIWNVVYSLDVFRAFTVFSSSYSMPFVSSSPILMRSLSTRATMSSNSKTLRLENARGRDYDSKVNDSACSFRAHCFSFSFRLHCASLSFHCASFRFHFVCISLPFRFHFFILWFLS